MNAVSVGEMYEAPRNITGGGGGAFGGFGGLGGFGEFGGRPGDGGEGGGALQVRGVYTRVHPSLLNIVYLGQSDVRYASLVIDDNVIEVITEVSVPMFVIDDDDDESRIGNHKSGLNEVIYDGSPLLYSTATSAAVNDRLNTEISFILPK